MQRYKLLRGRGSCRKRLSVHGQRGKSKETPQYLLEMPVGLHCHTQTHGILWKECLAIVFLWVWVCSCGSQSGLQSRSEVWWPRRTPYRDPRCIAHAWPGNLRCNSRWWRIVSSSKCLDSGQPLSCLSVVQGDVVTPFPCQWLPDFYFPPWFFSSFTCTHPIIIYKPVTWRGSQAPGLTKAWQSLISYPIYPLEKKTIFNAVFFLGIYFFPNKVVSGLCFFSHFLLKMFFL